MLYRASEHNFRATAFHQKCDDQEDTLVFIRIEYGKTIGGYTHHPGKQRVDGLTTAVAGLSSSPGYDGEV